MSDRAAGRRDGPARAARGGSWSGRLPAAVRRWVAAEIAPMARVALSGPVLAVLVLSLPLLVLLYQFPQTKVIDIGGSRNSAGNRADVGRDDDFLYVKGFKPSERVGDVEFRWTGDIARIDVPMVAGNAFWTGTLRLSGERPEGTPSPVVEVLADDRSVARFATARPFAEYTFTYRREPLPTGDLAIVLKTTTFVPPDDPRPLGVAVDKLTLTPVRLGPAQPYLPPLRYLCTVPALLGLAAALLGWLGVAPRRVALVVGSGLALIAAGVLRWPDLTARYLPALLGVAATLVVVALLLRPLLRRLFAAGGVTLDAREGRLLFGVFLFGAASHLAGVFFPGFWAHDMGFQTNRLEEVLSGKLLLSTVSAEWGYRRTPYPPALYLLAAPLAAVSDASFALRLLPPLIDAASVFPIFYLLRRLRQADPAPILAAFCYTLLPATFQLLWWGFFPNLFGQFATLVALTLVVGHWDDLVRLRWWLALAIMLAVALLSHPGTFVLTLALLPLLAGALAFGQGANRRSAGALALACGAAVAIAYALYYRHFAVLLVDQARAAVAGAEVLPDGVSADRSWIPSYIGRRVFALPFFLYFALAWATGVRLALARRPLGWALLAVLLTATFFAVVHLLAGVWVRYFVFLGPALAIGAGVALGWLWRRARWGKLATYATLAYCLAAAGSFWIGVAVIGKRSPYP